MKFVSNLQQDWEYRHNVDNIHHFDQHINYHSHNLNDYYLQGDQHDQPHSSAQSKHNHSLIESSSASSSSTLVHTLISKLANSITMFGGDANNATLSASSASASASASSSSSSSSSSSALSLLSPASSSSPSSPSTTIMVDTIRNVTLSMESMVRSEPTVGNLSDSDTSSSSSGYVPYEARAETYIVPIIFLCIFVLGTIGNGTVIYIFCQHKSMRTVANVYILSLAVGDLALIFITVPFVSTIYTFESWPYGLAVCKISEFARDLSMGVTVFTLTSLSVQRYAATHHPIRYLSNKGRNTLTQTNTMIWLLAVVLATPGAYNSHLYELLVEPGHRVYVCYPYPERLGATYAKSMVVLKCLAYYVIPLAIIATFYSLMARSLIRTTENPIGNNESQNKLLRNRRKISRIVLGLVVIFAICFFPNQVFMLWFYFDPHASEHYNTFWHVWRIIGFVLSFFNSCLNPIVLCTISGVFRSHFKRYMLSCVRRVPRTREMSVTFAGGGAAGPGGGGGVGGAGAPTFAGSVGCASAFGPGLGGPSDGNRSSGPMMDGDGGSSTKTIMMTTMVLSSRSCRSPPSHPSPQTTTMASPTRVTVLAHTPSPTPHISPKLTTGSMVEGITPTVICDKLLLNRTSLSFTSPSHSSCSSSSSFAGVLPNSHPCDALHSTHPLHQTTSK